MDSRGRSPSRFKSLQIGLNRLKSANAEKNNSRLRTAVSSVSPGLEKMIEQESGVDASIYDNMVCNGNGKNLGGFNGFWPKRVKTGVFAEKGGKNSLTF
jgi:hypothetical protein